MQPSPIILTHVSTANRRTQLSFNSEAEAKLWAYRMRQSPKTRSVALYYSVLPQAKPQVKQAQIETKSDSQRWHWLTRLWRYTNS